MDEALDILHRADEEGLVLQPSNAQNIINICLCCGDCCQVLLSLKRHPRPVDVVASPFVAKLDSDLCTGCETCLDRCQMETLTMDGDTAKLDARRCIGCGLCVSTCPSGALSLERKPEADQPTVPVTQMEALQLRAKARAEMDDKLARHQRLDDRG